MLIAGDVFNANAIDIVDCGTQSDGIGNVAGTGFELVGNRLKHRLLKRHIRNHIAAALPWRHVFQHFTLTQTTPMPVGPNTLWPEKTKKSASRSCTSTRMCETDCAPSTKALAPTRCASSTISLIGVTVPSAFETCVTATILVRSLSSLRYSSSRI